MAGSALNLFCQGYNRPALRSLGSYGSVLRQRCAKSSADLQADLLVEECFSVAQVLR